MTNLIVMPQKQCHSLIHIFFLISILQHLYNDILFQPPIGQNIRNLNTFLLARSPSSMRILRNIQIQKFLISTVSLLVRLLMPITYLNPSTCGSYRQSSVIFLTKVLHIYLSASMSKFKFGQNWTSKIKHRHRQNSRTSLCDRRLYARNFRIFEN